MADDFATSVRLSARGSTGEGELRIEYRLENHSRQPIHVWDQLLNYTEPQPFIDDNLAYVFWEAPRTVRIVRALLRLPSDFQVGKMPEPFVRTVSSAESISGRIRLPTPLHEYSPLYAAGESMKKVECDQITLVIGWVEDKPGIELSPRAVRDRQVNRLGGAWNSPLQRFATAHLAISTPLFTYTTPFDRRMPIE